MERTLLLVDDEENITSALTRVLRRDGYRILRANGGREGLEILAHNEVGVIISDQRMPEMTGTEFLSQVRERYPDTIRIVLSGYTDLNSVTDAINRGAIYKFLTKPWEDDLLRANVEEAFRRYEMERENSRLSAELKAANEALAALNAELAQRVEQKTREAGLNLHILGVAQEILDHLPQAVLGVGEDGLIAVANRRAQQWFGGNGPVLGEAAATCIPAALLDGDADDGEEPPIPRAFTLPDGRKGRYWWYDMGGRSDARGRCLVVDMDQAGGG